MGRAGQSQAVKRKNCLAGSRSSSSPCLPSSVILALMWLSFLDLAQISSGNDIAYEHQKEDPHSEACQPFPRVSIASHYRHSTFLTLGVGWKESTHTLLVALTLTAREVWEMHTYSLRMEILLLDPMEVSNTTHPVLTTPTPLNKRGPTIDC